MKKFLTDDQGAFLVFGVLLLVPLILMMGLTVDGVNFSRSQRRVQQCADMAAHAGIVRYSMSRNVSEAQNLATQVFSVNAANIVGLGAPAATIDTSNNILTVSATVTVPTYIMQLGGATSKSFTVSSTAQLQENSGAEVAVIIDSSQNNLYWYPYFSVMITGLQDFVTSLNSNVLVSITPINTSIRLDSTKLNISNFLSKLSTTATDVTADSVYYPLNTKNISPLLAPSTAYSFYTEPGKFPVKRSANASGWGFVWNSGGTWGGVCLAGMCYPNYSYQMESIPSILPLTKNKTLLSTYLTNLTRWLSGWRDCSDGLFSSLMVWGWRTIDPGWSSTLSANSTSNTTVYGYGVYPKAYGTTPKYAILMVHDQNYWDAAWLIYDSASRNYGYIIYDSNSACATGNCSWLMTMYGMMPNPKDTCNFYSASCENFYYKSVDQFLGLGATYVNSAVTETNNISSYTYMDDCVTAINSQKFLTVCKNMRTEGITLYVISAASSAGNNGRNSVTDGNNARYFAQCTGDSSRVYTGITTAAAMTSTLKTIATSINTSAGQSTASSTTVLSLIAG